jgi:hypothetical protein
MYKRALGKTALGTKLTLPHQRAVLKPSHKSMLECSDVLRRILGPNVFQFLVALDDEGKGDASR